MIYKSKNLLSIVEKSPTVLYTITFYTGALTEIDILIKPLKVNYIWRRQR